MNKLGHLLLGAISGLVLIMLTNLKFNWFNFDGIMSVVFIIIIIYIYSLLCDIDAKSSTIVWTFIPIGLAAAIFGFVMTNQVYLLCGIGLIAITFVAAQFLPHRGFAHSIIFGILVSSPLLYVSYEYAALGFICFYSHLCADGEFFKLT
jgi:membrane-bound metal-dependent hydrolase YbcI (DUF457 family)